MEKKNKEMLMMLGGEIRLLRWSRLWSQEDLAEYSGVSKNNISLIERGAADVKILTLRKLAVAFELPLSYLYYFILSPKDNNYFKKNELF